MTNLIRRAGCRIERLTFPRSSALAITTAGNANFPLLAPIARKWWLPAIVVTGMAGGADAPRDICPHTGRARLGYDRARVLLKKYTATVGSDGLELHQFRHFTATHLGDQKVPLQLIMAKTRHKSPRTVMRYVKPGDAAVAEVTSLLAPTRRSH